MSADLQPIQREKLLRTLVTSQLNERVDIIRSQRSLHYPNFSAKHTLLAWRMEILGSATALVALVAIAVVLVIYDNRPLPAWPHNITINTVVALLQQALNLGLTILVSESIAQAKWIWFFQNSHPLVEFSIVESASTGPWGSLLLLLNPKLIQGPAAAGAFLTLVILAVGPSTQQLISIQNRQIDIGIAKVPQSTGYDAVSFGGIQAVKTADLPLKGAIINGIYNTNPSVFSVSVDCLTGNCTWPIFSSLGVCSDCVDRTNSIAKDCPETNDCTFSLPGGEASITEGPSLNIFLNSTLAMNISDLASFSSIITQFQVMVNPDGGVGNTPPIAFGCSLYYCVKTYRTMVQSGALTEEILFTYPNSTSGPQTPKGDDDVVLSQDGQRYTVGAATAAAISTYISDQLTGSANGGTGEQVFTSDTMQAMYTAMTTKTSNIFLLLENVATSVSNTMRLDPNSSGHTFVNGTSLKTEAYILVRWY